MKRRIRKKRRMGEFREDCFQVDFRFDQQLSRSACDDVIDRFLGFVVDTGLQFGGCTDFCCSGIIEFCGRGGATVEHRSVVMDWLKKQPEISDESVGPLVDAWYGWD